MTVEQQTILSHDNGQDVGEFAKIQEVTHIEDAARIHNAIQACRGRGGGYEVNDVINLLLSEQAGPRTQPIPMPRAGNTVPTNTVATATASTTDAPPKDAAFIGPRNKPKSVIDLTAEQPDGEEFQRAIAASLKDTPGILGGQVTREEQEISRLIEQSLEESKAGTKRKRGEGLWFIDPLNPHERKREEDWPVGLKNIGNTCWFSAVIQSLFHLPVFRYLVLNFHIPGGADGAPPPARHLVFMSELRRLFALMVGSKRKYIDPSRAMEILKEAFISTSGSSSPDSQQDVSEFQHKLLEWLEDAYRRDVSRSPSPEPGPSTAESAPTTTAASTASPKGHGKVGNSSNPMVQLFYGQYLAEGMNEGKCFRNTETFGQFPLQVDGFNDIHESLEAATAQGEIETVNSDVTSKSRQELWFTRLPPVLTFELSRFQFNQKLGRPEKIHHRLQFPEELYMDRYMEYNKCVTRQKREEVNRLREELQALRGKLDKFVNYGSGSKRFPLQDVLQCALEFAQTRGTRTHCAHSPPPNHCPNSPPPSHCPNSPPSKLCTNSPPPNSPPPNLCPHSPPPNSPPPKLQLDITSSHDVDMESPKSSTSMQTESPSSSSSSKKITDGLPLPDIAMDTQSPLCSPGPSLAVGAAGGTPPPSPRHVSVTELATLQLCLCRWRKEVEQDVKELQDHISRREIAVQSMYSQQMKHRYRLHAVLVHEGQAASGHYWAYVFSGRYNKWLKFNDIQVTECAWEEIEREGVGGNHNTSAYCLMYIDPDQVPLDPPTGEEEQRPSVEGLAVDLQTLVTEDNWKFSQELQDWDRDQELKRAKSSQGGAGDGAMATTSGNASSSTATPPTMSGVTYAGGKPDKSAKMQRTAPSSKPLRTLPQSAYAEEHARVQVTMTIKMVADAINTTVYKKHGASIALKELRDQECVRLEELAAKVAAALPRRDARLQHMGVYLLAAGVTNKRMLDRVLLEQVSLIHNFDQDESARQIRQVAVRELDHILNETSYDEAVFYQRLHDDYHMFKEAVFAFLRGVEAYHHQHFMEALPYLCTACDKNSSLTSESGCGGGMRGVGAQLTTVMHFLRRQCLLYLNEATVQQFAAEADVGEEVYDVMQQLLLPTLTQLQAAHSCHDEQMIEEVRDKWCGLLSMQLPQDKIEKLQEFLSRLVDLPTEIQTLCSPAVLQFRDKGALSVELEASVERLHREGILSAALHDNG